MTRRRALGALEDLAERLAPVLLFAACVAASTDDVDDSFGGAGKNDTHSIEEESPEAIGVLRVANELDFDALDDKVKLSSRTAENIVGFRSGPDRELGTDDDIVIATLAELDGIPYVGPPRARRRAPMRARLTTGSTCPCRPQH